MSRVATSIPAERASAASDVDPTPMALDPARLVGADAGDFASLIETFNQAARTLESTHAGLQHEVARLRRELAEANARLRRSQALAALGEMAAGIAHEIRNPLGSIGLYAQALLEDLADRPAEHELCAKIDRAVTGLDGIVRDVLAFARDRAPQRDRIALGDVVATAVEQCAGLVDQHDVRIDVSARAAGAVEDTVDADAGLLGQAIGNVLRNAIEAMHDVPADERVVDVSITRTARRTTAGGRETVVSVHVDDRGPGIPEDVRDRMFNPFFTTRPTGTGLGLAIVHRIVDAHDGDVVVGTAPSGGARLTLSLPPAARSTTRPPAGSEPALIETRRTAPAAAPHGAEA